MKDRNLYLKVWEELVRDKNMIFLAGPRQSGKTTLSHIIAQKFSSNFYMNWDIPEHRRKFFENPVFFEEVPRKDLSAPLIVFDEIHKYKDFKNFLKGVYDQFHESYKFLVSGSGRLDIYQRGGDSLAGRYLMFHLFPFTIAELGKNNLTIDDFMKNPLQITMEKNSELREIWIQLANLSGFPEPYLSGRHTAYRRWSNTYSRQIIREDIRDLAGIKYADSVETLYFLLPLRIGSPLSLPSLARDLQVSYNSIKNWLAVFDRFFLSFSISTWTHKISRSIQKEHKVYLMDYPSITDPSARFENMVALELWRAVTLWNDLGYGNFSLHFVKNKEQQEVDFLIANYKKPFLLIEAKLSDIHLSSSLLKFQNMLDVPAVQVVSEEDTFRIITNRDQKILIAPAYQWLSLLP
jgi:predicted AAA+ superfamily ATPase